MLRTVHCLPLAFLFLVFVLPSYAQKEATIETSLSVEAGAPLKIECPVRPEQQVDWRLNGGEVPSDTRAAGEAPAGDGRLVATLRAPAARPHHAGLYTCSRDRRRAVRLTVTGDPLAPVAAEPSGPVGVEAPGASEGDDDASLVVYEVKGNITLTCPLFDRDTKETILWKKNGTAVMELPELKDRVRAEGNALQWLKRAQEEDFGNYTCARDGTEHAWRVHARPHAKLPANSNVVEGQALKLVCKVVGKPYPAVTWRFANASDEGEGEPLAAGDRDGRVKVSASEQEVAGAVLLVEDALRSDAGRYRCVVGPGGASADTVLRVKDMYAALWPFLGICAEVFILCAIILVYEKRRTKPELEDSDTDNHDQKKS